MSSPKLNSTKATIVYTSIENRARATTKQFNTKNNKKQKQKIKN